MGGYFITHGKRIYEDFFYNHQPGMAFLSAAVQYFRKPDSIAGLILYHRQAILLISFLSSVLLYLRFGYKMIAVTIIYELCKFYVFGDRFLAESIVGYFVIYQAGVIYGLFEKKKIDIYLMPIASFFIFFLREPFTVVTLLMLLTFSWSFFKKSRKTFYKILMIFLVPSILTFLTLSPGDYFFNVVSVNRTVFANDALNDPFLIKMLRIIFYPVYFLVSSRQWNLLRSFIALLSVAYIFCFFYAGFILQKMEIINCYFSNFVASQSKAGIR